MNALYAVSHFLFAILSWGFVDSNAPLPRIAVLQPVIYFQTIYPTALYSIGIILLFCWYFWVRRKGRHGHINAQTVWRLILVTTAIPLWSYPALSNDIFNYIATVKVTFLYRENPYLIMPIEVPNEPLLAFMHAANKVALYGPMWIALTGIPYYFGFGNLILMVFLFKKLKTGGLV